MVTQGRAMALHTARTLLKSALNKALFKRGQWLHTSHKKNDFAVFLILKE